jgi:hypothetical protein
MGKGAVVAMSFKSIFDPEERLVGFAKWKGELRERFETVVAPPPVLETKPEPAAPQDAPTEFIEYPPFHRHVCKSCRHLSSYVDVVNKYDLYYCHGTLVVRWGDAAHVSGGVSQIRAAMEDHTIRETPHSGAFIIALNIFDKLRRRGAL